MNTAPGSARHLPVWRQRVAPVLLGLLRFAVAAVLTVGPLQLLLLPGSLIDSLLPSLAARYGLAALIVVGVVLYTWRRSLLIGLPVLLLGLGISDLLWRQTGFSDRLLAWGAGALILLAITDVVLARTQRRLYAPPATRV